MSIRDAGARIEKGRGAMKVTASRADAFLRSPGPNVHAVLLYGPDSGLVRERADGLVRAVADALDDPFRVAVLAAADLANDPARLADEAAAQALTGGRRAIWVRDAGDGLAETLAPVVERPIGDGLIVIEAGDLPARSRLRKLCEGADAAAAVPCYMADTKAMAGLVRTMLSDAGLAIDRDAESYAGDRLAGDRQLARREVEKLIAYMGSDRRVDLAAVMACVGDTAAQSLDDLVLATGDGDRGTVDRILEKLFAEGVSPVAVLRTAQRHFGRVHLAAAAIARGDAPDRAMAALRPPVFFKAQPRFRRQLSRWQPDLAGRALALLVDCEAMCKRTGVPAQTVCARTMLQVATMARPRG